MITKTKEWFNFDPFPVVNDKTKHFWVEENMVYLSLKDEMFSTDKETISYYNWDLWVISDKKLNNLVGEFVDSIESIDWFLVLSKWNYFWVINTYMDKVFSYYWNLHSIKSNDDNDTVWFVIGKWSEIFFYSNKWWVVCTEYLHSELNKGILVLHDEEKDKYEWYNEFGNLLFSQIGGNVIFDENCLLIYDEVSGYGCYSYVLWKMILDCEYDMIYSRKNYIIGVKESWYTILHQFNGKLLEGIYDEVIPQRWFLIMKSNEDYLTLDGEWNVLMEWKRFMYIDDNLTIHTYSPKWDKIKKIEEKYFWLF